MGFDFFDCEKNGEHNVRSVEISELFEMCDIFYFGTDSCDRV